MGTSGTKNSLSNLDSINKVSFRKFRSICFSSLFMIFLIMAVNAANHRQAIAGQPRSGAFSCRSAFTLLCSLSILRTINEFPLCIIHGLAASVQTKPDHFVQNCADHNASRLIFRLLIIRHFYRLGNKCHFGLSWRTPSCSNSFNCLAYISHRPFH